MIDEHILDGHVDRDNCKKIAEAFIDLGVNIIDN